MRHWRCIKYTDAPPHSVPLTSFQLPILLKCKGSLRYKTANMPSPLAPAPLQRRWPHCRRNETTIFLHRDQRYVRVLMLSGHAPVHYSWNNLYNAPCWFVHGAPPLSGAHTNSSPEDLAAVGAQLHSSLGTFALHEWYMESYPVEQENELSYQSLKNQRQSVQIALTHLSLL